MVVIKRNGKAVEFDDRKIYRAIERCSKEVNGQASISYSIDDLVNDVRALVCQTETIEIEDIQDAVEKVFMDKELYAEAKAYIIYRNKRTTLREGRSDLMDSIGEIVKLSRRDNANVGNSPSAKLLQIAEEASKEYYLDHMIPPRFSEKHNDGSIHIHDMGWYGKTLTCLQIPLGRLLKDGFHNGHGYIKTPKSIRSAAALAAIILQSNQNDMHGGQSFSNFDRDMAPYVKIEYNRQRVKIEAQVRYYNGFSGHGIVTPNINRVQAMALVETEKEVYQAMEGLVYNLNTMHSRAGAQVPFSSINLGLDTSVGGRIITEQFLKAYEAGLGKGESPIFPNVCFQLKKGVNFCKGDPNYDLFQHAMRCSCKRLFPNYSFQDSSFNKEFADKGEYVAYMGCRTRVVSNVNGDAVTDGRGNLSFTSINLPRIALEVQAKWGDSQRETMDNFYRLLDERLVLVRDQLLERYHVQANLHGADFPFLFGEHLYLGSENIGPGDKIEPAIKHGTLSIGFIGLAEALKCLVGVHHGEDEKGINDVGIYIVKRMRDFCDKASEEYGLNFSLLATPAESTAGRFGRIDREKFGIVPGVTDKPYGYTNSFHVPVEHQMSMFDKIEIEGKYHRYCNAGHISYVELASAPTHNVEAFEILLNAMADADMGYAAVNFPVDICRNCGLNAVIDSDECPKCGGTNIDRVRRITGYLSTLDNFNSSKQEEVKQRVVHSSGMSENFNSPS